MWNITSLEDTCVRYFKRIFHDVLKMGRKAIMKVALMDSISKIACTKTITLQEKMMTTTIHLIFQFSCKDWIIFQDGTWKGHTVEKLEFSFKNCQKKSWARVFRKYFYWQFWYQNLILETWNWKSIQNTWSIEAKIFEK